MPGLKVVYSNGCQRFEVAYDDVSLGAEFSGVVSRFLSECRGVERGADKCAGCLDGRVAVGGGLSAVAACETVGCGCAGRVDGCGVVAVNGRCVGQSECVSVGAGCGVDAAGLLCGDGESDGSVGAAGEAGVAGVSKVLGPNGGESFGRGKNYQRNLESRLRKKQLKREASDVGVPEWRRKGSSPPSLSPTVETVTTGMAEEMEARRTLALRRSAENKVAAALAEHRLRSLADKDKTAALAKLDAARVEQRINDAKAKSQASYKKCDESLGSLGSAGSAGEFALKKEVQAAKDEVLAVKREKDYYEKQLSVAISFLPPEGMRAVAELPEPVYDDDRVDDCGLDELPEDLPVNDKVAYLTRMGCQDAAEALLFETYGF